VYLDLFADKPEQLEITPEELQYHSNLVIQAQKLFNSRHYDHYDFLFSLSDSVGGKGLEHHQSSEDGTRANYFTDWAAGVPGRALLPHEYVHSWNGKFRRPADLWTPNFNVPMQNDLLWVYEGLTDYYGNVLTARSGMRTPEQARDSIAQIAATFEISPGRTWRSLEDTTNQPISPSSPHTAPRRSFGRVGSVRTTIIRNRTSSGLMPTLKSVSLATDKSPSTISRSCFSESITEATLLSPIPLKISSKS